MRTKKGRISQIDYCPAALSVLDGREYYVYGQDRPRAASKRAQRHQTDTINTVVNRDSLTVADSLAAENKRKMLEMTASPDLKEQPVPYRQSAKGCRPQKVGTYSQQKPPGLPSSFPAVDRIYNRKYWKLPIFYGGFAGCAYALTWNSKMYKDYSAAYKDAVNGNPNTSTINDLLPPNYNYTESQLTETFSEKGNLSGDTAT